MRYADKLRMLMPVFFLMTCSLLMVSSVLADGSSDPTKPADIVMSMMPESGTVRPAEFSLSGVQENGKASVAIINHTMVRIGDQIQGYTLKSVRHGQARLVAKDQPDMLLSMDIKDFRRPVKAEKPFLMKHKTRHHPRSTRDKKTGSLPTEESHS